jgi:DNA phosphorothioation-associated putative methyltransferase
VVNVIEDKLERIEALEAAFGLAKEVLSVSAMLATTNQGLVGRCYRDGVITGRSTFQKYYTQGELQQFIEQVLDHDAYPAAPGVFYVFKDRAVEQSYLISKSANRSRVARARLGTIVPLPTPRRAKSAPIVPIESDEALQYIQLLWNTVLELGRLPLNEEVPTPATAQRCFGSVKRAIGLCLARNDPTVLQRAREGRIDDILVMIALQFFGKRRKFNEFSARLQRDVKEFFGSLRTAEVRAQHVLFSVQSAEVIRVACENASTLGLGWLESGSLQLHTSLVEQLPATLRVYLGCATALAGSITSADLVKAHIDTGKVTLLTFDDFTGKPLPALRSRIKVRLRDQDLDIFNYGESFPPTILYWK